MFSSVGSIGPYLQSLTESLKSSRLYQAVRIVRRAQNSPYDESSLTPGRKNWQGASIQPDVSKIFCLLHNFCIILTYWFAIFSFLFFLLCARISCIRTYMLSTGKPQFSLLYYLILIIPDHFLYIGLFGCKNYHIDFHVDKL